MIREAIILKQKTLGLSNRSICEHIGANESTYSSFIAGTRPLPFDQLERLLDMLRLKLVDC